MSRTICTEPRRSGHCRPRLERLESRLTLNATPASHPLSFLFGSAVPGQGLTVVPAQVGELGPYLSVVSFSPDPPAPLAAGPTIISINFDRPLDPASAIGNDILVQVRQGTRWVNVYDPLQAPTETVDGTALSLSLPQALTAGDYQLVLPEFSNLTGLDGSMVADLGSDQVVGGFSVSRPGVTTADSQPLPFPDGTVFTQPGSLDLAADPGAVGLYSFTVPSGHHWRLGAEISSQRDGGTLASALTLFDSNGNPVATSNLGRPDAPGDAYLFAGLNAGTYYLGVSGQGNLPTLGGYDLRGHRGTISHPQPGGDYALHIAADLADQPVRLLGATLNFADSLDPRPTGFSLAFSGVLDTRTLLGNPTSGLQLINARGQTFPITAVGQNEIGASYNFVFDSALPAGLYRVVEPDRGSGGVTDLAGLTPVASDYPRGVLYQFEVAGSRPVDPLDLGVLYSGRVSIQKGPEALAAGAGVSYRFVTLVPGPYKLEFLDSKGTISASVNGQGFDQGTRGSSGQATDLELSLAAGVYWVNFRNSGSTSTSLRWSISQSVGWDSLLENGVGQGPALNLRLISPSGSTLFASQSGSSATGSGTTSPIGPIGAPGTWTSTPVPVSPTGNPDPAGPASTQSPLFLTLGNTMVGRPMVTGWTASNQSLARESIEIPQGLENTPARLAYDNGDDVEAPAPAAGGQAPAPTDGALPAEVVAASVRPDDMVIAAAEWLTRAGDTAARWLALAPVEASNDLGPAGVPIAVTGRFPGEGPPISSESDRVERAQIGPPLAIALASILTVRLRHPLARWVRRMAGVEDRDRWSESSTFRGPHGRT